MAPMQSIFSTASVVFLTSCMSLTPYLDSQFGSTVAKLKEQQTLDPQASVRNTQPPTMDARAAREAVNTYNASYRAPQPQQSVFTIGVGR